MRHLSPKACSVKPQILKFRMRCKPKRRMLFMLEISATLCNLEVGTVDDMRDKPCSFVTYIPVHCCLNT